MGLFKNEVGRPSNETIKKRNIFKVICALLVIVIIGLVGYILNDKGVFGTNSTKKGEDCPIMDGGALKTVKFNTRGGNTIDSISICVTCPPKTIVLPTPKRNGYLFDGWYADSKLTKKVEGGRNDVNNATWTEVGCDDYETTIFAKWKKEENNQNIITTTKNSNFGNKENEKAIELFNKMNFLTSTLDTLSTDGNIDYWSYFYTFDKVNVKDVDNDIKLALAFSRYFIDDFGLVSYDTEKRDVAKNKILKHTANSSKINEKYKELFVEEISDYNINVEVLGFGIKYNSSKNNYSFDSAPIGDVSGARVITKIINTNVTNNKIEVINKALFVADSPDGIGIYKNVKLASRNKLNSECKNSKNPFCYFGVSDELEFYEGESGPKLDEISIDKYINELNSYKWTFVKTNDGNYMFESVEKFK